MEIKAISLEEHLSLFHSGKDCRAYEFMGSHPAEFDGKNGYMYCFWNTTFDNV